jgi:hypothetical protein
MSGYGLLATWDWYISSTNIMGDPLRTCAEWCSVLHVADFGLAYHYGFKLWSMVVTESHRHTCTAATFIPIDALRMSNLTATIPPIPTTTSYPKLTAVRSPAPSAPPTSPLRLAQPHLLPEIHFAMDTHQAISHVRAKVLRNHYPTTNDGHAKIRSRLFCVKA